MKIFRSPLPCWTRRTHLFRPDEYICSACRASCDKPYTTCPKCGARLEVRVEGTAVHVAVLKLKEPRVAAAANMKVPASI